MRFKHTQDPQALDEAIQHDSHAIDAWRQLVEAAGDVYTDDLRMDRPSANLAGHWRDELAALEKGHAALEEEYHNLQARDVRHEMRVGTWFLTSPLLGWRGGGNALLLPDPFFIF